jgi:ribosomal protein L24
MVAMNASDLRIERAPSTLTLSKDKGYNIAVGDTVEVARGQWRHSQGVVKAVDLIKASLDFVRLEDGIQVSCPVFHLDLSYPSLQINVPITFSRKVKERFDYGLSKFVGRDVWVIGGDKKGTRATLRSLGRTSSWVAIFGQPIELKNNQVATP